MKGTVIWVALSTNFVLLALCDNLSLLSGTLRTYERAACDDQTFKLACPSGTRITVELARYGSSVEIAAALCDTPKMNASCAWSSLEYSLLQTVVEACQKKRTCKFTASPKAFGTDPCPGIRKYVEIAYKCRPYEFRSKVACENDVVLLQCNPNSRIAIYSASYGRTEYESVQCPQPQGVPEETCLVSYATETVIHICHGKRRCTLSADSATFGNPCRKESRMYLKVVYTCVPRRVLSEQFNDRPEEDETLDPEDDFDNYDALDDVFRDGDAFSPSPNLAGGNRQNSSSYLPQSPSTHVPYSSSDEVNPNENKERMYLYLMLSVGGGLIALMALVIGRLLWQRHYSKRKAKYEASAAVPGSTSLANGFNDEITEVDADIDLTLATPVSMMHTSHQIPVEVGRYGGGDVSAPRSLTRSGNSQYYYG